MCQKPLGRPTGHTCLVDHCRPCFAFHQGLFIKGTQVRCKFCRREKELHAVRLKRIYELIVSIAVDTAEPSTPNRKTPKKAKKVALKDTTDLAKLPRPLARESLEIIIYPRPRPKRLPLDAIPELTMYALEVLQDWIPKRDDGFRDGKVLIDRLYNDIYEDIKLEAELEATIQERCNAFWGWLPTKHSFRKVAKDEGFMLSAAEEQALERQAMDSFSAERYELMYGNDASSDSDEEVLEKLPEKDTRVSNVALTPRADRNMVDMDFNTTSSPEELRALPIRPMSTTEGSSGEDSNKAPSEPSDGTDDGHGVVDSDQVVIDEDQTQTVVEEGQEIVDEDQADVVKTTCGASNQDPNNEPHGPVPKEPDAAQLANRKKNAAKKARRKARIAAEAARDEDIAMGDISSWDDQTVTAYFKAVQPKAGDSIICYLDAWISLGPKRRMRIFCDSNDSHLRYFHGAMFALYLVDYPCDFLNCRYCLFSSLTQARQVRESLYLWTRGIAHDDDKGMKILMPSQAATNHMVSLGLADAFDIVHVLRAMIQQFDESDLFVFYLIQVLLAQLAAFVRMTEPDFADGVNEENVQGVKKLPWWRWSERYMNQHAKAERGVYDLLKLMVANKDDTMFYPTMTGPHTDSCPAKTPLKRKRGEAAPATPKKDETTPKKDETTAKRDEATPGRDEATPNRDENATYMMHQVRVTPRGMTSALAKYILQIGPEEPHRRGERADGTN